MIACQPRPPTPSMSQTRIGKVRNNTGQALSGAIAAADSAPATNAIARRRQPHDRTIQLANLVSFTVRATGSHWDGRHRRAMERAAPLPPATALSHHVLSANDDPCADKF